MSIHSLVVANGNVHRESFCTAYTGEVSLHNVEEFWSSTVASSLAPRWSGAGQSA